MDPELTFTPGSPILVNAMMMYGLGWENWMRLFVWLAIGLTIYFLYGRTHSHLARK